MRIQVKGRNGAKGLRSFSVSGGPGFSRTHSTRIISGSVFLVCPLAPV